VVRRDDGREVAGPGAAGHPVMPGRRSSGSRVTGHGSCWAARNNLSRRANWHVTVTWGTSH
jgi:hypothetical protein